MQKTPLLFAAFLLLPPACAAADKQLEKLEKQCRSGNQKSCGKLEEIARNSPDSTARRAATASLTDQKLLLAILKTDRDSGVRQAALARVTDEDAIVAVAVNDPDPAVRDQAMRKVSNPVALARIAPQVAGSCGSLKGLIRSVAASCAGGRCGSLPVHRADKVAVRVTTSFCLSDGTAAIHPPLEQYLQGIASAGPVEPGVPVLHVVVAGWTEPTDYSGAGRLFPGASVAAVLVLENRDGGRWVECMYASRGAPRAFSLPKGGAEWLSKPENAPFFDVALSELSGALATQVYRAAGEAGLMEIGGRTGGAVADFASEGLRDPARLAYLAAHTTSETQQTVVVHRVTSQDALKEIATSKARWNVRRDAVEEIADQAVLAKIAASDPDAPVRIAACQRLTDQGLLSHIVTGDADTAVKKFAVELLAAREIVAREAGGKRSAAERAEALARLATAGEYAVNRVAVQQIDDEAVLEGIARGSKDRGTRNLAIGRIRTPAVLGRLIVETEQNRWAAAKALNDPAVLAQLAVHPRFDVREAIVDKITDPALLFKISVEARARNDEYESLERRAASRLNDRDLLIDIAKTTKHAAVRWAALLRLSDFPPDADLTAEAKARCSAVSSNQGVTPGR